MPTVIDLQTIQSQVGHRVDLLEHLDLSILFLNFGFQVFQSGLSELSNLDFRLQKLLLLLVSLLAGASQLRLEVAHFRLTTPLTVFKHQKTLVFVLDVLRLLLDKHFQVLLVVEDLLEISLDRSHHALVLLISLLQSPVFLLKRPNLDLDVSQLLVSLRKQVLQLEDLLVRLSLQILQLLHRLLLRLQVES